MGPIVMYANLPADLLHHEVTQRFTFGLRYLHSTERRAEGLRR